MWYGSVNKPSLRNEQVYFTQIILSKLQLEHNSLEFTDLIKRFSPLVAARIRHLINNQDISEKYDE